MRSDDPDLRIKVLRMFRNGFDTMHISDVLEIRESLIERALHSAMALERMKDGESRV